VNTATPEYKQHAVGLVKSLGSLRGAAKQLEMSRSTLRHWVKADALNGVDDLEFEVEPLPDELPTADELLERRTAEWDRVDAAKKARRLINVKVKMGGPIGLMHFGDPHVDDPGTNIRLLREHVDIVNRTDGLFGGNIGDLQNNWVGRLARLYSEQSTSAQEAWVLVEWLVNSIDWLYLIRGNHDCHSEDTEALTRRGWKSYSDIQADDEVFGINPETDRGEWQRISEFVDREVDEELVRIESCPIDLLCTSGHRVMYRPKSNNELKFKTAGEFLNDKPQYRIPLATSYDGGCALSDDWIKLVGLLMADGHYKKGHGYVSFSQKDVSEIVGLTKRLGFNPRIAHRPSRPAFGKPSGYYEPTQEAHFCAAESREIRKILPSRTEVPDWAWAMSDRQFGLFMEALMDGDGAWNKKDAGYLADKTISIFDDVQALCAMHGWGAWIKNVKGRTERRLNVKRGRTYCWTAAHSKITSERYKGRVWCLTVPHGNFLVRRNGKQHFSGNCWSEAGDPLDWMKRGGNGVHEPHGARLNLTFPNGKEIRINARHDFKGHSMWNNVHGPLKAAKMGWRDHILVCGHKHVSGYTMDMDPATGLISHIIRVAGYKIHDRYAIELGLPDGNISPSCVTIIDPSKSDDDPACIQFFADVESGADYLTWLRARS